MKSYKFLLFLCVVVFSLKAEERYSQRSCVLLPITDNIQGALGYKVYEEVEKYLMTADWCRYEKISDLLDVFSRYRQQLDQYLNDPKVLKTVAEKSRSGSLIRIKLEGSSTEVVITINIWGQSGEDLLFRESLTLDKVEIYLIRQTIINWLELYDLSIPYDGLISGVLGNQVSFKVDKKRKLTKGAKFKIVKPIRKNKHPLLKKVVGWETIEIGKGIVSKVSRDQAILVIERKYSRDPVLVGDWIVYDTEDQVQKEKDPFLTDEKKSYQFGRLGDANVSFKVTNSTLNINTDSDSLNYTGVMLGVDFRTQAWITRNYFFLAEFSRLLGDYKARGGGTSRSSLETSTGHILIGGGHKILPLGYFYGPQIDLFLGYANRTNVVQRSASDYADTINITGFSLGVGGNMPLVRGVRLFARGEMMPFATFNRTGTLYPAASNVSSFLVELGGVYQYYPNLKLEGSFELQNNTVKLKSSSVNELSQRDNSIRFGVVYTY